MYKFQGFLLTICIVPFALLLNSCFEHPALTMDKYSHIRKHISIPEFRDTLRYVTDSLDFAVNDKTYRLYIQQILLDAVMVHTYTIEGRNYGGAKSEVKSLQSTHSDVSYDKFLFLFENNSLLYWGYMADFYQAEDPKIQQLADEVYTRIFPATPK